MKRCNYWISEGIESHFSIDGTFVHALVATIQLLDGHRQFGHSAPPIWTFISGTTLTWISCILSISYLSAVLACTNTDSTALLPSKIGPFEQVLDLFFWCRILWWCRYMLCHSSQIWIFYFYFLLQNRILQMVRTKFIIAYRRVFTTKYQIHKDIILQYSVIFHTK